MKRNRKISEKPDAILTSDWHLRETKPRCRTDNFWETQWEKVNSIWKIQTEWEDDIKLFHAGDLFHHWKPSPWLISMTMKHLPENFYTVFGQHDLPNHNMSLSEKSGVMTLAVAGWIKLIEEGSWKEGLRNSIPLKLNGRNIAILHQFVWDGKKIPWPGCSELTAEQMLDKYPQFDLIVTGDHHKPFTYEKDGRLLVNPGPLTRQKADETFNPRVYLWYSNTNTVIPYYLPIKKDVISDVHIREKENRDDRIDAFVSRLDDDLDVTLNYEKNLEIYASQNNIRNEIMEIVYESIDKSE